MLTYRCRATNLLQIPFRAMTRRQLDSADVMALVGRGGDGGRNNGPLTHVCAVAISDACGRQAALRQKKERERGHVRDSVWRCTG